MPALDPRTAPAIRWGVLGAGFIAGKFINAVQQHTESTVVAVGSRDGEKAAAFASEHGIERAHGSYDALVADSDVDAIYVATPHSHHRDHALLAIAAGKPVLIEKPIARTAAEAREIAEAARNAGVFAMEAMWTRFLPHMVELHEAIGRGELGEVVQVNAEHGQRFAYDPLHRIFNPALAGGALLDLGVYPLSFVQSILGAPTTVRATGSLTETGVDANVALALSNEASQQASVATTLLGLTEIGATVIGTEARAAFDGVFLRPTTLRIKRIDGSERTFDGTARNGFQYEVAEVARAIAEGRTESAVHGLDAAIEVLETIDDARHQLGVYYPGEPGRRVASEHDAVD